jgi:hypothetical protein
MDASRWRSIPLTARARRSAWQSPLARSNTGKPSAGDQDQLVHQRWIQDRQPGADCTAKRKPNHMSPFDLEGGHEVFDETGQVCDLV